MFLSARMFRLCFLLLSRNHILLGIRNLAVLMAAGLPSLQDASAIVKVLELWAEHGDAFMEWKDNPPPPPQPVQPPPPPVPVQAQAPEEEPEGRCSPAFIEGFLPQHAEQKASIPNSALPCLRPARWGCSFTTPQSPPTPSGLLPCDPAPPGAVAGSSGWEHAWQWVAAW